MSTEVLATLGIRYAFTVALPRLGVATVMSALPAADPACLHTDAQASHVGGATMSATTAVRRDRRRRLPYRLQRYCGRRRHAWCSASCSLVWSLAPIYNMWMIALDSHDDVFSGTIWPEHPSLDSFRVVVTQDFWYLAHFWHQFGNSFYRRPDDDVPDAAHRLARQLHGRADASTQGWLLTQRGADDLRDPGVVPGDPVLPDHADLWAGEQSLVGDRSD